MEPNKEKKVNKFLSEAFVFLCLAMFFTFSSSAYEEETTIQVIVSSDPIIEGEMVNISIYCMPGQPIKAFELSVYFNASILQVNKIVEGTIFKGYETYYNNGTIDNSKGQITDIFDLIIGVGNVSSSGYLVNISFTAQSVSGESQIQIVNAGVTNETQYVPLTVINGSVTITQFSPIISNINLRSSSPMDTDALFGWINISCNIYDDNLNFVKVIIVCPNGSSLNLSMIEGSEEVYFYNTSFSTFGQYTLFIWCKDFNDNSNSSTFFVYSICPNWDINFDGDITVFDLILISNHFNEQGAPGWIREDIDNNGHIEMLDVVLAAIHYNDNW